MPRTTQEIAAQIHRMEVSANDARFDAGMRAMFRKSVRSLKRELAAA